MAARPTILARLAASETRLDRIERILEILAQRVTTALVDAPTVAAKAAPAVAQAAAPAQEAPVDPVVKVCSCGRTFSNGRLASEIALAPLGLCGLKLTSRTAHGGPRS